MEKEKKELPKENEVVLCTVKEIKKPQVFLIIDKYGVEGVMQFSEVAPGRIRNIREYVSPNKKVVCKVLRILDSGHIDLSLRRVTEKERRSVMEEYTREKDSESLLKAILKDKFEDIKQKILERYKSFYKFLEEFKKNREIVREVGIEEKYLKEIEEEIERRFKEKEIRKKFLLEIKTTAEDGIERIKKFLVEISQEAKILYISAPRYEITIEGNDIKQINKKLKKINLLIEREKNNFDLLILKEID
jgi:translation initiation factor 2 subunit 1